MKHFKRIYIYKDSKLPEKGWFQGCFICYHKTARLLTFDTKETSKTITEYVVYVCPQCKKELQKNENLKEEYKTKCQEYININNL